MSTCLYGVLLWSFFLCINPAFAEADGPDFYAVRGVAPGDVLNIRREAKATSENIGEIPPDGRCIRNLGCIGGLTYGEFTTLPEAEKEKIKKERPRWCQIEYQGIRGWVAGRYLKEGFCEKAVRPTHE